MNSNRSINVWGDLQQNFFKRASVSIFCLSDQERLQLRLAPKNNCEPTLFLLSYFLGVKRLKNNEMILSCELSITEARKIQASAGFRRLLLGYKLGTKPLGINYLRQRSYMLRVSIVPLHPLWVNSVIYMRKRCTLFLLTEAWVEYCDEQFYFSVLSMLDRSTKRKWQYK